MSRASRPGVHGLLPHPGQEVEIAQDAEDGFVWAKDFFGW